jgi:hypothetical protein
MIHSRLFHLPSPICQFCKWKRKIYKKFSQHVHHVLGVFITEAAFKTRWLQEVIVPPTVEQRHAWLWA